jgi:hypothetical protein
MYTVQCLPIWKCVHGALPPTPFSLVRAANSHLVPPATQPETCCLFNDRSGRQPTFLRSSPRRRSRGGRDWRALGTHRAGDYRLLAESYLICELPLPRLTAQACWALGPRLRGVQTTRPGRDMPLGKEMGATSSSAAPDRSPARARSRRIPVRVQKHPRPFEWRAWDGQGMSRTGFSQRKRPQCY